MGRIFNFFVAQIIFYVMDVVLFNILNPSLQFKGASFYTSSGAHFSFPWGTKSLFMRLKGRIFWFCRLTSSKKGTFYTKIGATLLSCSEGMLLSFCLTEVIKSAFTFLRGAESPFYNNGGA